MNNVCSAQVKKSCFHLLFYQLNVICHIFLDNRVTQNFDSKSWNGIFDIFLNQRRPQQIDQRICLLIITQPHFLYHFGACFYCVFLFSLHWKVFLLRLNGYCMYYNNEIICKEKIKIAFPVYRKSFDILLILM